MYSAFGIDHGYEEVDKGFLSAVGGAARKVAGLFEGGGARVAEAGRHAASLGGGSHRAAGAPKLLSPHPFKDVGGFHRNMSAPGGGARIAGAHKGPAKLQNPFGASGGARKAGAHAAGRRKAF